MKPDNPIGQQERIARAVRLKELVSLPVWKDVQTILVDEWANGLQKIRNGANPNDLLEGKIQIIVVERIIGEITGDIGIGTIEQQKVVASLEKQNAFSVRDR